MSLGTLLLVAIALACDCVPFRPKNSSIKLKSLKIASNSQHVRAGPRGSVNSAVALLKELSNFGRMQSPSPKASLVVKWLVCGISGALLGRQLSSVSVHVQLVWLFLLPSLQRSKLLLSFYLYCSGFCDFRSCVSVEKHCLVVLVF